MRRNVVISLALVAAVPAFQGPRLPEESKAVRGLVPVVAYDDTRERVVLYEESHALLIGCSSYQSGWTKLPGVLRDTEAVATLLMDHGFSVTKVYDANRETMDKAIREFIGRHGHRAEARLIFYFAGHGYTEPSGGRMSYIVPVDAPVPSTDLAGFRERAFPLEFFSVYAKSFDAKHALFVFDACFSGSIFDTTRGSKKESLAYSATKAVRQFISSGRADEAVSDGGVFSECFIAGLRGGADADGDGYITGTQLGEYLYEKVSNHPGSRQHPQHGKLADPMFNKGDFIFVVPSKQAAVPGEACPDVRFLSGPLEGTYRNIAEDVRLACQGVARISTVVTQGSIYNLSKLMEATDVFTIGLTQDDSVDEISDARTAKLKLVMPLYRAEMHLLTLADAPIFKLEDLKDKRVATGPLGSGTRATALRIKALTGLTWEDVPYYTAEVLPDLRDHKLDAVFFVGGAPISFYSDFPKGMEHFVKLVPIEHSALTGRYEPCVIRGGDYKWLGRDVPTYGVTAYIAAARNVPDEFLAVLASTILENMDALRYRRAIWNRVRPGAYVGAKLTMPAKVQEQIKRWQQRRD